MFMLRRGFVLGLLLASGCTPGATGAGHDGGPDGGPVDGGGSDQAPARVAVPPATNWLCGGGGAATADTGRQHNLSIGGSVVVGESRGSGGETMTFGGFSTTTFDTP